MVTKHVPDYALMVGVPATQIGWISEYGQKMSFTQTEKDVCLCENTGNMYILEDGVCRKIKR